MIKFKHDEKTLEDALYIPKERSKMLLKYISDTFSNHFFILKEKILSAEDKGTFDPDISDIIISESGMVKLPIKYLIETAIIPAFGKCENESEVCFVGTVIGLNLNNLIKNASINKKEIVNSNIHFPIEDTWIFDAFCNELNENDIKEGKFSLLLQKAMKWCTNIDDIAYQSFMLGYYFDPEKIKNKKVKNYLNFLKSNNDKFPFQF